MVVVVVMGIVSYNSYGSFISLKKVPKEKSCLFGYQRRKEKTGETNKSQQLLRKFCEQNLLAEWFEIVMYDQLLILLRISDKLSS